MKLRDVVLVFVLWVISAPFIESIVVHATGAHGWIYDLLLWGKLDAAIRWAVFWIALPLLLLRCSGKRGLVELGLVNPGFKKALIFVVLAGLALGVHFLVNRLLHHILPSPGSWYGGAVGRSRQHLSWGQLLFAEVTGTALLSPVAQEIFFRGMFQRFATERAGKVFGVIIAALLFAFWHEKYDLYHLTRYFGSGLIYGVLYLKTRSLYPAILCHCAWNLYVVLGHLVF